jgi:transposase
MMGRQAVDQSQLFYLFNLEEHIPKDHLLRRINPIVTRVLADLREQLAPFYSDIGRPSIDPELMIRMLIVGYCYGIRFERRLCEEVKLHLGYRWFCRLELLDKFLIIRRSRSIATAVFEIATSSVRCSRRWSERAWMQVSSRARASQLMRAS